MTTENYPAYYETLQRLTLELGSKIPNTLGPFSQLHKNALADGAIPRKIKELMALGIAITGHCKGCIAFHVHDALKAGASLEEVHEAIGVALLMGGGPAVVYGCEALSALQQFQKQ